jgi:site-specific DNA-methyltransferase (adenine-specific)
MVYYPKRGEDGRYPRSVIYWPSDEAGFHPMQKPVGLLKRFIELYTLPGDTVLDPTMGSGSTGVAALELGRSFIGIEKHEPFFRAASARLEEAARRIQLGHSAAPSSGR